MKNEKLKDKLARVGELAGSEDALERDLALQILREVYSEIKFGEREVADEPEFTTPSAVEAADTPPLHGEEFAQGEQLSSFLKEQCPQPQVSGEVAGSDTEQVLEQKPEPESEQISEPEPEPEQEPEQEPEEASEPEPEPESEEVPEPEPAFEEVHEPEPLPEPEPAPEEDELPVTARRRRVAPEVIRSLYGDGPVEKLGDVINPGRQTLGETLRGDKKDMASKLAASGRRDLKSSIGINDKFLMVRDMFDGDVKAFNDTIAYLDNFTDLDEAIIYIHDNYNWSADSDGVKLLVDLLERKLG